MTEKNPKRITFELARKLAQKANKLLSNTQPKVDAPYTPESYYQADEWKKRVTRHLN